jgi:hypothetical protein
MDASTTSPIFFMRLLATLRALILPLSLALALVGCTKAADAAAPIAGSEAHPLAGKWIDVRGFPGCTPDFEFRADGSLVMSDGHGTQSFDGALGAIDAQGYYAWSGRFHAASGTPQCLLIESGAAGPIHLYGRLMKGGERLAICLSESAEDCHFYLGRSPDQPGRTVRPEELGLAEALRVAIERAAGAPGAKIALELADASTPLFVVADQPVTVSCEQAGAWSAYDGGLLGGISGARCANAARVSELAEGTLADAKLAELVKRGAPQAPGLALSRETLADGSTLSYFPVLATGHGIIVLFTATLVHPAKTSAIVVQATTTQACPQTPRADTPRLCSDPKGFVIEVAKALAASPAR